MNQLISYTRSGTGMTVGDPNVYLEWLLKRQEEVQKVQAQNAEVSREYLRLMMSVTACLKN